METPFGHLFANCVEQLGPKISPICGARVGRVLMTMLILMEPQQVPKTTQTLNKPLNTP
jgi:hypothetical protein